MSTRSIAITVRFIGAKLKAIAGTGEARISVPPATCLGSLMGVLSPVFSRKDEVIDPRTNVLRTQYRMLLNGRFVDAQADGEMLLHDGDCVSLLPTASGG
jgi:molybdopterin converting factor small subunit